MTVMDKLRAPPPTGLSQPLKSFQQLLTSAIEALSLHASQEVRIPVRIGNPGSEIWFSAGPRPVTISYKWFANDRMLPIEGERTLLPAPVGPGQSVDANVRVIAPNEPGNFDLRISLVQESVGWFMAKSNTYLKLPATVN